MNVGFIGIGRMGAGMAANLLKAGHRVTVYNRTPGKARSLIAQGAHLAHCIGEACQGDAVNTMLADDEAVESIALGSGGIVASLAAGAMHISSSTISVALSHRLADAHAGQQFIAVPVFGRPDAAAAGALFVVTGGRTIAVEKARPPLEAFSQQIFPISDDPKQPTS
jgi:3-hydroxyisobutyrate dehydrogenase-like beta-hydroxyacid dehydrogenase